MMRIFSPSATMDGPFEGIDCRTEDGPWRRSNARTQINGKSTEPIPLPRGWHDV
jgi:hypothetical protein